MKVRLTAGSRYNPNAYAWYLGGFDVHGRVGGQRGALRLFVYGPRRDAGFGLQPVQPMAGTNWSFWRTGLVVPGLVIGSVALGLSLLLLEIGAGLFKSAVPALWASFGAAAFTSPLFCFLAVTALRVARLTHNTWASARRGSLGLVAAATLISIGLSGLFGVKHPQVAGASTRKLAEVSPISRWDGARLSSPEWARVTRKAHELNAWNGATPVTLVWPTHPSAVVAAPLLGLGQITAQVRLAGVDSLPRGSAWPCLPAQLASRVASVRALSSSWHFFLEALSNQGVRFNSTSAMRPHQFSGALRALPEYRAQPQPPFPPLTPPSDLSQRTTPLTLSSSVAAAGRGRLVQSADWVLKAKPWSRV